MPFLSQRDGRYNSVLSRWQHCETWSCADELVRLAESIGSDAKRADALACRGVCEGFASRSRESEHTLDRAAVLARASGCDRALRTSLGFRGVVHLTHSAYELAEQDYLATLALAAESTLFYICHEGLCLSRGKLGRVDEALEDHARTRVHAQRSGLEADATRVSWLHRELGDWSTAMRFDLEALAGRHHRSETPLVAAVSLGLSQLEQGELVRAREALASAESHQASGRLLPRLCAAQIEELRCELRWREGDTQAAAASAQHLLELAEAGQFREQAAIARQKLARAAVQARDPERAHAHLTAALSIVKRWPMPFVAWKVHADVAHQARDRGNTAAASVAAERALELISKIAASVPDGELRAAFLRKSGSTFGPALARAIPVVRRLVPN